jgi:hypothetical protein
MEIALYVLSGIGFGAVLLFFYVAVRDVINHGTEIDKLKRWHHSLNSSVDKAHDSHHELKERVEELEGAVADHIIDQIAVAKLSRRK